MLGAARRRAERFLSRSFDIGPAAHLEAGGYHVDMRVKAEGAEVPEIWPSEPGDGIYVYLAQWGLGCYERYLAGEDERWLAGARAGAEILLSDQADDGGWVHRFDYGHTFPLKAPWLSAMAQGEGASLLARLHVETGEERYAEAALRALRPYSAISAPLGGGRFPEEYPTDPPSHVLNGGIFALWGLHDVGAVLGDGAARRDFEAGVDALAADLHRWDTGSWSRYDLFPHPVVNVASPAYHALHAIQLRATDRLAPRRELAATAARFEAYGRSPTRRAAALARKGLFRAAVPRSERIGRLLPWSRV